MLGLRATNAFTSWGNASPWLERKVVRLLWATIGAVSIFAGWIAYRGMVGAVGTWIAVGLAVLVWAATGWLLQRSELKGAPDHIEFID